MVGHISDEAHASPALPLPPGHPAEAPCQTGYLPRRPQWVRDGRLTMARWAEIPGYTAGQERPAWNSPHQPQAPSRSWPPEHVAPVGGRWRGSHFLILFACIEVVGLDRSTRREPCGVGRLSLHAAPNHTPKSRSKSSASRWLSPGALAAGSASVGRPQGPGRGGLISLGIAPPGE